MARRPPPIATIRLARSWARLLALPAILVTAAVAAIVAALAAVPAPFSVALAAIAALPGIAGVGLALRVATMRVEVEEAAIELRWLGGRRTYALVPGPVTRVRLRGEQASSLRARTGLLGWQVGAARLRGDEPVEVVRLAPTRTAILVPTDRGRLAIAAASEPSLLDALSRAARARTRLEALAGLAVDDEHGADGSDADAATSEAGGPPTLEIEAPPHILTGIERAMLDERLARQRTEAEHAERPEIETVPRDEADAAARLVVDGPAEDQAAEAARTDAVAVSTESDGARTDADADVADDVAGDEAAPRPMVTAFERTPVEARTMLVLIVLPLVVTVALWGTAGALGRLPEPTSEPGRLTALALVLAGPGTSVGALMARAWWPRLVTVVVTSGLASAVLIGRSLLFA